MINADDYRAVSQAALPPAPKTHRRRQREPFLRGPVPMAWLAKAQTLTKAAMGVAIALWFQKGVRGQGGPVKVTSAVRRHMGLSNDQTRRGIQALAASGLLRVRKGGRGRCAIVELIAYGASEAVPTSDDSDTGITVARLRNRAMIEGQPQRERHVAAQLKRG